MNKSHYAAIFIDTSGYDKAVVSVVIAGKIFERRFAARNNWSEKILPRIASLLKKSDVTQRQIRGIFVVTCPGSFSGTRTGVAVANALAFAWSVPVVAVPAGTTAINIGKRLKSLAGFRASKQNFIRPLYSKAPHITRPKQRV